MKNNNNITSATATTSVQTDAEAFEFDALLERVHAAGNALGQYIKGQRATLPKGTRKGSPTHEDWLYSTYGVPLDLIRFDPKYTPEHDVLAAEILRAAVTAAAYVPAKRGATSHIVGQVCHAVTSIADQFPGLALRWPHRANTFPRGQQ